MMFFPSWPWPPHPLGLFSNSKAQVMLLPAVGPEHHFRDAFSPQFKLNFRNICEVVIELGACRLKMFPFEVQGWSAETLGIQEVGPLCCNGEKSWSHLLINAKCSLWHAAGAPMCSLFSVWGMTPAQSHLWCDSQEGAQVPQTISGMWHSAPLPPKASGCMMEDDIIVIYY